MPKKSAPKKLAKKKAARSKKSLTREAIMLQLAPLLADEGIVTADDLESIDGFDERSIRGGRHE